MKKEDLKIGDHVSFLRLSNKAVSLTGTISAIHEEGVPCVDVELDTGGFETAHVDDVTVLRAEKPAKEKSKSAKD